MLEVERLKRAHENLDPTPSLRRFLCREEAALHERAVRHDRQVGTFAHHARAAERQRVVRPGYGPAYGWR